MSDLQPRSLKPNEFVSRLRTSREFFDRAVAAGHIRVVRLGRRVTVPLDEVERIEREGLPTIRRSPATSK